MTTLSRAVLAALLLAAYAGVAPLGAQASRPDTAGAPATLPTIRVPPPASAGAQRVVATPAPPARRPGPVEPAVTLPAGAGTGSAGQPTERWQDIDPTVAGRPLRLPVGEGHAGPSVLRVQVLLQRALFSSGMLDGRWGRNTRTAVVWFQAREGLPTTGVVDDATFARLEAIAGDAPVVVEVTLSEHDVSGPFVTIPADIYQHARLRCSCYESLAEKLSETFHSRVELLGRLNPGVRLNEVRAGTRLLVPAVRDPELRAGEIRQIVVSGTGNYLQALDADGRILYHFPATLGSSVDPSPQGEFRVTSIHPNPWWHYQPRLLAHVANDRPNAMIPPGPNNAVGTVWMSLSAPHYGIHGTRSPETIGYAESAGCVRLTNWDAEFLSRRVAPGTPVAFRDTRRGPVPAQAPTARPPGAPAVLGVPADSAAAPAPDPAPDPAPEPADDDDSAPDADAEPPAGR